VTRLFWRKPNAIVPLSPRGILGRSIAALLLFCVTIGVGVIPAGAVQPDEVLTDARMEARARHISAGLRCMVCQNQSIDDSNAPLAHDLRVLVRERLKAGDSDKAVVSYIVQRYGDFVLLKPPFNVETVLLWMAPLLLLIGAAAFAWGQFRGSDRQAAQGKTAEAPLSADETRRLEEILHKDV
jgi:cytochrome c-type biogenesis protein CcmH